jgi:hypothetical protein
MAAAHRKIKILDEAVLDGGVVIENMNASDGRCCPTTKWKTDFELVNFHASQLPAFKN